MKKEEKFEEVDENKKTFDEVQEERESEEHFPEEVIPLVETEELSWKEAAKKLKSEVDKNKDNFTIDTYYVKIKVAELRERYNNKERSVGLHAEIMAL